jgi:hypothetical protein
MRRHAAVLSPVLALLLPELALASDDRPRLRPQVARAERFVVSRPARDLARARGNATEVRGAVTVVDTPRLPEPPDAGAAGHVDGALQDAAATPAGGLPPIAVSFAGLSNLDNLARFGTEVIPASTNVAVGPNHLLQGTNFLFRVFDKTGNPVTDPFPISDLFQGTGGNCEQYDRGDPIVEYDPFTDRWTIATFAYEATTTPPYSLCVAFSQTPDPTESYFAWEFSTGNQFPNLPQWGVWPDGHYASYIQFTNGTVFDGTGVIVADRLAMFAGDPGATFQYFDISSIQPSVFGCLPSSHEGFVAPPPGTPNLLVCPLTSAGLGLFEIDADFADPSRSYAIELPESPLALVPYDGAEPTGFDDIEQPSPATATSYLDAAAHRLMGRMTYRNLPGGVQSYLLNFTVNVSGVAPTTPATHQAGIRWVELRRNAGVHSVFQQGTLAEGPGNGVGRNLWMAAVAQDNEGNLGMAYSASGVDLLPSVHYTGRLAADTPGTLLAPATLQAGGGVQLTTSSRWGDYASIAVDPADDCTFWPTNVYFTADSNATWSTRIASFKFPDCGTPPQGTVNGIVKDCNTGSGAGYAGTGQIRLSDGHVIRVSDGGQFTATLPPGTYAGTYSDYFRAESAVTFTVVENQVTTVEFCVSAGGNLRGLEATILLLTETCDPPNGATDPGEIVTADLCLTNNTGSPTADLTGVLYPSGGLVSTPGPKDYGVIDPAQTVCSSFTFSIDPSLTAGTPVFLNLQLSGGPAPFFVVSQLTAGAAIVELAQDFEGVVPPALPAGFTASGGPPAFVTTASSPLGSNALFIDNAPVASDSFVQFPPVTVDSGTLRVSFDHVINLESGFDGGALEISTDGGATWKDVLEAGGTFDSGGYNSIISPSQGSSLAGKSAWSGGLYDAIAGTSMSSPHTAGTVALLRLHMASDSTGSGNGGPNPSGWWVDGFSAWDGGAVCAPIATGLDIDSHAIAGSSSNQNLTLEPGEDILVGSFQVNGTPSPLPLTGTASNFSGPPGAAYVIVDATANYGSIPGNIASSPASTGDCFGATGDCYVLGISNPAPRPAAHWDATFDEALSSGGSKTWTLHVGSSFADVPTGNIFYRFIETIFHNSITGGCGAGYCPGNATLRKQMAVFVLKAVEGAAYVPPAATGVFNDVPQDDPFAPWIEELFRRGVVAGCAAPGGPNYCPENPVLRQQMAIFLLRTRFGAGYVPPVCQSIFGDVLCPSPFADWIEDLYNRGITGGCQTSPLLYCGGNSVTRGQMAVFLTKAFGLLLYGP